MLKSEGVALCRWLAHHCLQCTHHQIPALNFVSLFLVTAVLFDTFVVRSLVAPAILALFGDANWWPNRPREALKSVL